jgi:hypothetical protein
MADKKSPEEIMFDQVACYLFKGSLASARKEFYLQLFAEWSKENLDIILKAISQRSE